MPSHRLLLRAALVAVLLCSGCGPGGDLPAPGGSGSDGPGGETEASVTPVRVQEVDGGVDLSWVLRADSTELTCDEANVSTVTLAFSSDAGSPPPLGPGTPAPCADTGGHATVFHVSPLPPGDYGLRASATTDAGTSYEADVRLVVVADVRESRVAVLPLVLAYQAPGADPGGPVDGPPGVDTPVCDPDTDPSCAPQDDGCDPNDPSCAPQDDGCDPNDPSCAPEAPPPASCDPGDSSCSGSDLVRSGRATPGHPGASRRISRPGPAR